MAKVPGWALIAGGVGAWYLLRPRVTLATTQATTPTAGANALLGQNTSLNLNAKADAGGVIATALVAAPSILTAIGSLKGQSWGAQSKSKDAYADAFEQRLSGGSFDIGDIDTSAAETDGPSYDLTDERPSGMMGVSGKSCWFQDDC
jgi:hypothetical protein